MSRKKSASSSNTESSRTSATKRRRIPEPFHIVEASSTTIDGISTKVPSLTLRGEWLRRCGFPIGAAAYVTPDQRGELILHRLGLGVPRRIRIVAAPARPRERRGR